MPEQLLDKTHIGPVLQHVRGAGVPEHVTPPFAGHPRSLQPVGHHARQGVAVKAGAVAGQKQRLRARVQAQPGTHFPQIAFDPGQGTLAHGHDAAISVDLRYETRTNVEHVLSVKHVLSADISFLAVGFTRRGLCESQSAIVLLHRVVSLTER